MGWLVESALAGRWSRQGSVKATKKRRMYQLMRIFSWLGQHLSKTFKKKSENQNICSEIQGNEQERFSVCEYSKLTSWLLPWLQHDHVDFDNGATGCCVNLILRKSLLRSGSKLIQVVPEKAFILVDGSQALAWSESGKDEQYDQYGRPFFCLHYNPWFDFFANNGSPQKRWKCQSRGFLDVSRRWAWRPNSWSGCRRTLNWRPPGDLDP